MSMENPTQWWSRKRIKTIAPMRIKWNSSMAQNNSVQQKEGRMLRVAGSLTKGKWIEKCQTRENGTICFYFLSNRRWLPNGVFVCDKWATNLWKKIKRKRQITEVKKKQSKASIYWFHYYSVLLYWIVHLVLCLLWGWLLWISKRQKIIVTELHMHAHTFITLSGPHKNENHCVSSHSFDASGEAKRAYEKKAQRKIVRRPTVKSINRANNIA